MSKAVSETTHFKNFAWSDEAINSWEEIWFLLWKIGVIWEWQNGDRYARRRGEEFNLFAVHNDADRLDMAIPLPQIHVVLQMSNWLLGAHIDDTTANDAINLIRKWCATYVE
jgi:hypothetical protein